MNVALSFPAINGETVTEGHAKYCQDNGHATHTVDGETALHCPRCGDKLDSCGSVTDVSETEPEESPMRTYAEYLATMTVKTLNTLAKELQLRGYSKLRKAALVEIVARQIGMDEMAACHADSMGELPVAETQDVDDLYDMLFASEINAPREITDARHLELINDGMHFIRKEAAIVDMPEVAALHRKMAADKPAQKAPEATFSSAPKATKAPAPVVAQSAPESVGIMETVEAYRNMRATVNGMGNKPLRVRLVARLREMSAQIRAAGMNPAVL